MLSKRAILFFRMISKLMEFFGSSCLQANKYSDTLSISETSLSKNKRIGNIFLTLGWGVVATVIVIQAYLTHHWEDYYIKLTYYLNSLMICVFYVLVCFWTRDLCQIANGTINFLRGFQETYMPTFDPDRDKVNLFVDGMVFLFGGCGLVGTIFVAVLGVMSPRSIIFIGGIIPEEYFHPWVRLLVSLVQVHIITVVGLCMVFVVGICHIYLSYVGLILTKEFHLGRMRYRTEDILRNPEHLRLMYRSFQVLHANVLYIFGYILVITYGGFMILPILSNFLLIQYWCTLPWLGKIPLLISSPFIKAGWAVVCLYGRYLFLKGNKDLGSWKGNGWGSRKEIKIMAKFRVSCRPIMISYGTQYVIRRVSLLLYFRGITRGIFRCLLALNK